MNRKSIAAYTEETVGYPAFISVDQETDGTCSITVRERVRMFTQETGMPML